MNALLARAVRRPGADPSPPAPPHWDVRTPEYAVFPRIRTEKWECVRGMDKSFGFNRNSREEDFIGHAELVHGLADIVAKNGNLLLNVGPRGVDGSIPEPQLRRLAWLERWLARCGEAIYGTRPWERAEGRTRDGLGVRFTARDGTVYAILLGTPPAPRVVLEDVVLPRGARVRLVGGGPIAWRPDGRAVAVDVPLPLPDEPAHVLALEGARPGGEP
jgi:alpha-L-fucosidase